jgi:hypothetical protein
MREHNHQQAAAHMFTNTLFYEPSGRASVCCAGCAAIKNSRRRIAIMMIVEEKQTALSMNTPVFLMLNICACTCSTTIENDCRNDGSDGSDSVARIC